MPQGTQLLEAEEEFEPMISRSRTCCAMLPPVKNKLAPISQVTCESTKVILCCYRNPRRRTGSFQWENIFVHIFRRALEKHSCCQCYQARISASPGSQSDLQLKIKQRHEQKELNFKQLKPEAGTQKGGLVCTKN